MSHFNPLNHRIISIYLVPYGPLVNHSELYTYEWELQNTGIPGSNSPDMTVTIEPSFSLSSFYQCEVNIQHSPGARRRYKGSEISIRTFGKLLVIYSVCGYYAHVHY